MRSEEKGKPIVDKYPINVRLVIGSLDSADLIEKEAAAADVVIGKFCPHSLSSGCEEA